MRKRVDLEMQTNVSNQDLTLFWRLGVSPQMTVTVVIVFTYIEECKPCHHHTPSSSSSSSSSCFFGEEWTLFCRLSSTRKTLKDCVSTEVAASLRPH